MTRKNETLYSSLKRIFHEPSRLAIVSALCKEQHGLTFNQLKKECKLTFGNLSSHLKTLQDAGVIHIEKYFVDNKPCTSVSLTDSGLEQFVKYLKALEEVLQKAAEAVAETDKDFTWPFLSIKAARA